MTNKSILVIEDDLAIRETIRYVLEMDGYHVLTAANGAEGVEILKEKAMEKTALGLILLDLMMPVMDGWEFLREYRQSLNEGMSGESVSAAPPSVEAVPVVVLSASGLRTKPEGADAIFEKPIEIEGLLQVAYDYCRADAS